MFDEQFYSLYTESSMFVYLFQDLYINILLATIIVPFKLNFATSIFIVLFGTEFLCVMTYKFVVYVQMCPCRMKSKNATEHREEIIHEHFIYSGNNINETMEISTPDFANSE